MPYCFQIWPIYKKIKFTKANNIFTMDLEYTWILWQEKIVVAIIDIIYWPVCSSSKREEDDVKEGGGVSS